MLNKRKIKQRFNVASDSYEDEAIVQKECAKILTGMLAKLTDFHPTSILDLGTGTGYIPELLLPVFPNSSYTLNDIAPNMLQRAKEKFDSLPQFAFELNDLEITDFGFHELIISNLALQWIGQLEPVIKNSYINSDVVAFSYLLDGTFEEWNDILRAHNLPSSSYQYPSHNKLIDFLLSLNPQHYLFEVKNFQLTFKNAKAFICYLKNLGASLGLQEVPLGKLKKLITTHNQEFKITYRVFFGILRRI